MTLFRILVLPDILNVGLVRGAGRAALLLSL